MSSSTGLQTLSIKTDSGLRVNATCLVVTERIFIAKGLSSNRKAKVIWCDHYKTAMARTEKWLLFGKRAGGKGYFDKWYA